MIGDKKDTTSFEVLPPLRELVREDHPLLELDAKLNFDFVRERMSPLYSRIGRPSIPPETLFRIFIIGYLYDLRSEKNLLRAVADDLAFRWFARYPLGEKVPSASTLSACRRRCGAKLFTELLAELSRQCEAAGVISLSAAHAYRPLPKRAGRIRQHAAAERYVGSLFEEKE